MFLEEIGDLILMFRSQVDLLIKLKIRSLIPSESPPWTSVSDSGTFFPPFTVWDK